MQDCYLEEYPVHGGKIPLDILQPNSCLQNLALVRPNIRQQLLNLGGGNVGHLWTYNLGVTRFPLIKSRHNPCFIRIDQTLTRVSCVCWTTSLVPIFSMIPTCNKTRQWHPIICSKPNSALIYLYLSIVSLNREISAKPHLAREIDNVPVNKNSTASRISRVQTQDA